MIKGLAITPPVLGRISIGRVIEKNGIRLPQKDNQFTITSQVQEKDGWLLHPLDEELRKDAPNGKLRTIPVRMLFNEADLNLRAEYTMFDRKSGRPMCVGNGDTCRRLTQSGVQSWPTLCEFGKGGLCKPYGRLNVKVGDDDDLGTFIFCTTGYNSIRTLAARLSYYQAVSGGLWQSTCVYAVGIEATGQKRNTEPSDADLLRGFGYQGRGAIAGGGCPSQRES